MNTECSTHADDYGVKNFLRVFKQHLITSPTSFFTLRPNAGHGLLILEVSRSHTKRFTRVGRTPLDEWSAGRRDHYLTTQNNQKWQTYMYPTGFKPAIPAGERPQTYAWYHAATGTSTSPPYRSPIGGTLYKLTICNYESSVTSTL